MIILYIYITYIIIMIITGIISYKYFSKYSDKKIIQSNQDYEDDNINDVVSHIKLVNSFFDK